MPADKTATVTVSGAAVVGLTWALQDAVDVSEERLPGLSKDDARAEVDQLLGAVKILEEIGGPAQISAILKKRLQGMDADIDVRRAPGA